MLKISKALGRQTTPPSLLSLYHSRRLCDRAGKKGNFMVVLRILGREAILAKFFGARLVLTLAEVLWEE